MSLANRFLLLLSAMALPLISASLFADEPVSKSPSDSSTFSFFMENDLFGDTDQQYTNGIQIGWQSPDLAYYAQEERLPAWIHRTMGYLPWIHHPDSQKNIGITLGQKIFTPEDLEAFDLIIDDRPYAGWLYAGLSFTSKTTKRLDTFEIEVGIIGPESFGEDAQNFVHDVRGFSTVNGWNNQLENEPGIALIYERKWRPFYSKNADGWGYDFITHTGGAIGNVYSYLNAGAEIRAGWNLPGDFGTSLLRPGGNSNAPTTVNDPRLNANKNFGAHVFAGITGMFKLRDIFLDGNTFTDSHNVNKEYLVGDLVIGAAVVVSRFKLSYAQVFRTREFEKQDSRHNFGSVSLSITF